MRRKQVTFLEDFFFRNSHGIRNSSNQFSIDVKLLAGGP
jgi:hypothetical protein